VSDSLYEADILIWSERQGELLRRIAKGERVNDADLDWSNIAEEVESVGRGQLHDVQSFLLQAFRSMLKAEGWPKSALAPSWRAEARGFCIEAASRFSPSMRQRIDLTHLYADALKSVPEAIDGEPPLPLPQLCRLTLDELLAE
jgi:hypothetical protein